MNELLSLAIIKRCRAKQSMPGSALLYSDIYRKKYSPYLYEKADGSPAG
jgi:hypothetical protein